MQLQLLVNKPIVLLFLSAYSWWNTQCAQITVCSNALMFLPISVLNSSSDWFLQTTSFNFWVHISSWIILCVCHRTEGLLRHSFVVHSISEEVWRRHHGAGASLHSCHGHSSPPALFPADWLLHRQMHTDGPCASQTLLNTALHSRQPNKFKMQPKLQHSDSKVHTVLTAFSLWSQIKHIEWIPENRLRPIFTKLRNRKRLPIKKEKNPHLGCNKSLINQPTVEKAHHLEK